MLEHGTVGSPDAASPILQTGAMSSGNTERNGLRIGELAKHTGVSARSLRYYEQRGVLTSRRDRNGYRRYDSDVIPLVLNVRRLLDSGLSVADARQFGSCLASPDLGVSPCAPALDVYEQRLRNLDAQIATLTQLRSNLADQVERLRSQIQS